MNISNIYQIDSNVQIGIDVFSAALRPENLKKAWAHVRKKKGQGGADGITPAEFGANADVILKRLAKDVRAGSYTPGPLRTFSKRKKSGGTRKIWIWCLRDRVLQTAFHRQLSEVLEPTFEDSSFAYRPGRSVPMAGKRIVRHLRAGYVWVAESDIKSYFDNVPHGPLLERLYNAVPEPQLLDLVELWLEAGSTTPHLGLPQGAAISPILANLYLDEIDEVMARFDVKFVRYADDFVMMCKTPMLARGALAAMSKALEPLHLWLHPDKTRISNFENGFMFLNRLFMASALSEAGDIDGLDAHERENWDRSATVTPSAGQASHSDMPHVDMKVSQAQMSALFRHFGGEELPAPEIPKPDNSQGLQLVKKLPLGLSEDEDLRAPEEINIPIDLLESDESDLKVGESNEDKNLGEIPAWGAGLPAAQKSDLTPLIRTLYVTQAQHVLGRRNKAFTIEENGEEIWARSVHDVDRIDIGPHAKWEKGALDLALSSGTVINFCTGRGEIKGILQSPDQRYAKLQLLQAKQVLDQDLSLALARIIVAGKIANQRTKLKSWQGNMVKTRKKYLQKDRQLPLYLEGALAGIEAVLKPLKRYGARALLAKDHHQLLGFEGESAKLFQRAMDACLIGWSFKKRTRRPALDPVNAVLNWISSMLTRDMSIFIRRAGLHAGFGILHATDERRQACVYDLIEEFRGPIEYGVTLALFNQKKIRKEHFYIPPIDPDGIDTDPDQEPSVWISQQGRAAIIRAYEAHVNAKRVSYHGGKTNWRHIMHGQVRAYARHMRGLEYYAPYVSDF